MAIADNSESTYSTTRKKSFFREIMLDLRKSLRGDMHSITEIRKEMSQSFISQMKFVDTLKVHHNYIKESLIVCLDVDISDKERQLSLERMLLLFEMHAKAEEQTLYKLLNACSDKNPRIEGYMAQDEHVVIYRVIEDLRDLYYQSLWTEDVEAKCLMLCELIANHFKYEEQEVFPLTVNAVNVGQLNHLNSEYIGYCENFLGLNELRKNGILV